MEILGLELSKELLVVLAVGLTQIISLLSVADIKR